MLSTCCQIQPASEFCPTPRASLAGGGQSSGSDQIQKTQRSLNWATGKSASRLSEQAENLSALLLRSMIRLAQRAPK